MASTGGSQHDPYAEMFVNESMFPSSFYLYTHAYFVYTCLFCIHMPMHMSEHMSIYTPFHMSVNISMDRGRCIR